MKKDITDHSQKAKTKPYRSGVGMMLINRDGKIFAARRIDTRSEAWQMPQGGIDRGETPLEAALRELKEEVGTDNVEVIAESKDWYQYDLPDYLAAKLWKGKFQGQRQKWFAMRFLGKDSEINIATERPEFCEWKWTNHKELPDLIVHFKRDLYRDVIREFSSFIKSL
ncbi:MAG: RNA pyrophosphohydrolase [Proteobacteria bacterium]|nr:RNA pyrophosphohydrolase [Pseudomonadota bacterium]